MSTGEYTGGLPKSTDSSQQAPTNIGTFYIIFIYQVYSSLSMFFKYFENYLEGNVWQQLSNKAGEIICILPTHHTYINHNIQNLANIFWPMGKTLCGEFMALSLYKARTFFKAARLPSLYTTMWKCNQTARPAPHKGEYYSIARQDLYFRLDQTLSPSCSL